MSNTIAHLAVANKILKEYPLDIHDIDSFYLGSVAPDAIGSKAGCSREDKKRVHLRAGIRDAEWLRDEKMDLFQSRIQHFVSENIFASCGTQRDFSLGYLIHLLTDEWNHRTIRQTMLSIANSAGILESDKEFFQMMTNDLEALDYYLLTGDVHLQQILAHLLEQEVRCDLPGFIEKEYIECSIQWWRNTYLVNIRQRKLRYISEKDIHDFVDVAVREIVSALQQYLSSNPHFDTMRTS